MHRTAGASPRPRHGSRISPMPPADAEPRLGLVTAPADSRLDALLQLYQAAIPARERKPAAAVRAMAASARHRVGIAEAEGRLAGFFLLYVGESLALLEYLATDESLRGRGLG